MHKIFLIATLAATVALVAPFAAADPGMSIVANGAIGGVRVAYTAVYQAGAFDQQVWTFAFTGLLVGTCDAGGSPTIGFTCLNPAIRFSTGGTGVPLTPGLDEHVVTVQQGSFTGTVTQRVAGG